MALKQPPKHLHIVGICGVATSAIAIAFHQKGWLVTGSDKGFYPPVSTALEKAGIPFYAGWHPEKMIAPESGDVPDFIIVGTASGTGNPETTYAHEHGIPIRSDAEVRGEYFAKKNSIVCVGTWGKTSSTALLSHILTEAGMDPSYVIGGLSLSTSAARLGDSDWSVIEGDEYKSSPTDTRPKFAHITTTHLLLTAVSWDHADLYPTEKSFFSVFEDIVLTIPHNGRIVACKDNAGVLTILEKTKKEAVLYGKKQADQKTADYEYDHVTQTKDGLNLTIHHTGTAYAIQSAMIGAFQAENITGCFAMACEAGIEPKKIIAAIGSFAGLKRRLEKRLNGITSTSGVTVFDDIAHSGEKAAFVLKTLRSIYDAQIIAIFEPNIGGRQKETMSKYDQAFADADMVIIPHLTKLKIDENKEKPLEGKELAEYISKEHPNVFSIEDDADVVKKITGTARKGDVVVFLGSHGFRNMIEQTIEKLK
jgi:UDP-N-acetylmuramate: L-alanyl-gamma-D-glutamyl-meso-diaminopimelate ligase